MSESIPNRWRDMGVTANDSLSAGEKETTLTFPNDEPRGTIASDIPTIIKWVQSIEPADPLQLQTTADGKIMGIKATIPKSIIKLQASPRKSTTHSDMVSYGDYDE